MPEIQTENKPYSRAEISKRYRERKPAKFAECVKSWRQNHKQHLADYQRNYYRRKVAEKNFNDEFARLSGISI